jgi:D-threonate/D-erythronate kinase
MLPHPIPLCILADDLTGALDSAVDFVSQTAAVNVVYAPHASRDQKHLMALADAGSGFAIATGTRECDPSQASIHIKSFIPILARADCAFKKIDSLLRGPWAAEIAACWQSGQWDYCVIAPAFPELGRITRAGAQWMVDAQGEWQIACSDIVAVLGDYGIDAELVDAPQGLRKGVCVVNALEQDELNRLVALREHGSRILWCGSAGLSSALAGQALLSDTRLKTPVLGLFGSDHAVTQSQIEACGFVHERLAPSQAANGHAQSAKLHEHGAAFISLALDEGLRRDDAARIIAETFGQLVRAIDRPETLIVAGGETLQSLFPLLQIEGLKLVGKVAPGVPRSVIIGGPWAGVEVISKSGAFGVRTLWRELLLSNNLLREDR